MWEFHTEGKGSKDSSGDNQHEEPEERKELRCGGLNCTSRSFSIWVPDYQVIAKCTKCGYTAEVYSG